jgi:hypothetical protein
MRVVMHDNAWDPENYTSDVTLTNPLDVIAVSSQWRDAGGAALDLSGGDRRIDPATLGPVPDTTAPAFTDAVRSGNRTVTIAMSEPVTWYGNAKDEASFAYDDGVPATNDVAAQSVSISADGKTITVSFASDLPPSSTPGDAIVYVDETPGLDLGDIVDIDGNPMANQSDSI